MTKRPNTSLMLEICLYGTRDTGSGWLATDARGTMYGDGKPVPGRSFTEAVFDAVDTFVENYRDAMGHDLQEGLGRVYAAGGAQYHDIDLRRPPMFGDLRDWQPAQPLVLDACHILDAAGFEKLS